MRSQAAAPVIAVVLALVGMTAGCEKSSPKNTTAYRPLVVVSVAPLAGLAREIAGQLVAIETLLPPAANPTTFEPSMRQMAELERAIAVK